MENLYIDDCVIEITDQCHANCLQCDYSKKKHGKFLPIYELKMIVDQLEKMGTFKITLSGGEPFEHPDIIEIIKYIHQKNFALKIISNGYFITIEHLELISNMSRTTLTLSLLGNEEIHDYIVGIKGSYKKLIWNVEQLVNSKCRVEFQTAMMKVNLSCYDYIESIAAKYNIKCNFDPLITNINGKNDLVNLRLSDDELYCYYKKMALKQLEGSCILKKFHIENKINYSCCAGITLLNINSYGEVFVCGNVRISIGNVYNESIMNIWSCSSKLHEFRTRKIANECNECKHMSLCTRCVAISISEHQMMDNAPKECCRHIKILEKMFECE